METELQLARTYFGENYARWGTFLAAPNDYDPVRSTCSPTPAEPTSAALKLAHPELFADLDGDAQSDVYIYIRDNVDEHSPTPANCTRENDLQVIVGAVCISSTLSPRPDLDKITPIQLTTEGMLQYSPPNNNYAQRCGALGNCNSNL